MSILRSVAAGALVALAFGTISASAATFTPGGTLHYQYFFPDTSSPWPDSGDYAGLGSFTSVLGTADLTISPDNLTITFNGSQSGASFTGSSFNGPRYSDETNSIANFLSVTINAATDFAGFDLSRLFFDGDHIWLNLQGLLITEGQKISLDVNSVSAVPLPAALPLFATAIGGLGVFGRVRRRKSQTPAQA